MIMLGLIMVLQLFGMIVHRTSTFFHIMSTTTLSRTKKESDKDNTENLIQLAKRLGRIKSQAKFPISTRDSILSISSSTGSMGNEGDDDNILIGRKPNIMKKITQNLRRKKAVTNSMSVDHAFERRYRKLQSNLNESNEDHSLDEVYIHDNILGTKDTGTLAQRKTRAAVKTLRGQIKRTFQSSNEVMDTAHV